MYFLDLQYNKTSVNHTRTVYSKKRAPPTYKIPEYKRRYSGPLGTLERRPETFGQRVDKFIETNKNKTLGVTKSPKHEKQQQNQRFKDKTQSQSCNARPNLKCGSRSKTQNVKVTNLNLRSKN